MLGRVAQFGGMLTSSLLAVSPMFGMSPQPENTGIRIQDHVRVPFVANFGQIDRAVAYYAASSSGTVFVTSDGQIVYSVARGNARGSWSVTETPRGIRSLPKASRPTSTHASYFLGNDPTRWKSGVDTFGTVSLGQPWPGVSLDLVSNGKSVEKIFTVAPGGNPSRIQISVAGALWIRVRAGALILGTKLGEISFSAPKAFQERDGVRRPVTVAYQLHGRGYGFRLGGYDPSQPVLIDPLLEATYLGGSGGDEATALAIHPISGEVYVAGSTGSTDFPGTVGGAQLTKNGPGAVFVARLNAALTKLEQATYLGGSQLITGESDEAHGLAISPISGEVYVAGTTPSPTFPGTAGGAQSVYGGPFTSPTGNRGDGFVCRLSANLTTLQQSTYLGGSDFDEVNAIAIHPASGDVYVAGYTFSTDFPGTAGGAQQTKSTQSCCTGFVSRLNSALTSLKGATYLGGSSGDAAGALSINPMSGEIYVAGFTGSTDFPGTVGGAQPASAGGGDAFVARLNTALTEVNRATYLGGSDGDGASALAADPITGEIYVAGSTRSSNFPGTIGGAQASIGGGDDGFVARLNPALTELKQATYLGGSDGDAISAVAVHPITGEIYVAGYTSSMDLPGTAGGVQEANAGNTANFGNLDAFIARFNAALTALEQTTYLGGPGQDQAAALATHPLTGEVYVAGYANSGFPITAGASQPLFGGRTDAFIARLTADLAATPVRPEIHRVIPRPSARVVPR
jgi:hypothetical protein